MQAAVFHEFQGPIALEEVPVPIAPADGVVIEVKAAGVCRSDWHAWMGHDSTIKLPHVSGHEFSGLITEVGSSVVGWSVGDRVTIPFCCGCGSCDQCRQGETHLCDREYQVGFSGWGSFAEYVAVPFAQTNLVRLPDELDFVTAAALGCRFMTAFHALTTRGRGQPGEWLAVHGCGGVGLSAIQIGIALGMRVVAVDIGETKLALARQLGAEVVVNAADQSPVAAVREASSGGAHVSIDAVGSALAASNSIRCLRKRGRHVQIGLVIAEGATVPIPMNRIIALELEVLGSHGMPAHRYDELLTMITDGRVDPSRLIGDRIRIEAIGSAMEAMTDYATAGITVVEFE